MTTKTAQKGRKGGSIVYLCPDCTGTITAQGIRWQCSQPHPERETAQAQFKQAQDIKTRIQVLLQLGKSWSEIIVLIWQQRIRETDVSANNR